MRNCSLNPLVFLDVAVGRRAVGRLKFELFHDKLPITSENFRCLCTGETGLGYWLRPRWYRDTKFLRVVPGFMCQGGDFNFGSGLMGESIYGQKFRDEKFCYKRIEIDFRGDGDLRNAARSNWDTVVNLSATQILNSIETADFTSFLLSESSLIAPLLHAIIKTCGRTVPLNAVPKLLEIGKEQGLAVEWMCYSRKNFLAPEEQPHEHQSMEGEVEACRKVFGHVGDAYVLGPMTGEHWLFYEKMYLSANYLERGDFTIDVMMYDLPKDVQEAHPNKSGKRQVCSLLRKVDGTLHKFQLPPAQSLAYSSINLVFAIPACPAGLALGAPRTPANPTTTHIAFLVPTTGTPPPLLNL
ncbi:unnamed protein product [Effrenium voratum]|nr:unnamed protein product [Effrenium voratum]